MRHNPEYIYFIIDDEDELFFCEVCGEEIFFDDEEPHNPHQPGCPSDKNEMRSCSCSAIVCSGCCWECNEIDFEGRVVEPSMGPVMVALDLFDEHVSKLETHYTGGMSDVDDLEDWEHWIEVMLRLERSVTESEADLFEILGQYLVKADIYADLVDGRFVMHPRTLIQLLLKGESGGGDR